MTTQVQFLESIFSAKGSDLRKFHNMARSVIIFDEAQSMPIKCIHLFNTAMNFINKVCNSTILLCTATQPPFEKVERKINFSETPSLTEYIELPKRFKIINSVTHKGYGYSELKDFILEKYKQNKSILIILNTKAAAKALFDELSSDDCELKKEPDQLLHLSTNMCSAHRNNVIARLRKRLDDKEPVICVSTQLIEAGVDISFECVIRDIAGLDSIYQAAGRCNRHGEYEGAKEVYIINIESENLERLPDIKIGAKITKRLIRENNGDLNSADIINKYYHYYFQNQTQKNKMGYQLDGGETICDLLSCNIKGCGNYKNSGNTTQVTLQCAIRSAAKEFYVIDKGRTEIIVYYENSKELLEQFIKEKDITKKQKILKQLNKFSVSVYEYQLAELKNKNAIDSNAYEGLLVLDKKFYDDKIGINISSSH